MDLAIIGDALLRQAMQMDIPPPDPSARAPAPAAAPAAPAPLLPAGAQAALVLAMRELAPAAQGLDTTYLLELELMTGGMRLEARSDRRIEPGSELQLRQMPNGAVRVESVRSAPLPAPDAALREALRAAIPRQAPLNVLVEALRRGLVDPAVPVELRPALAALLTRVPSPTQARDPAGLRAALENSGTLLEPRLARALAARTAAAELPAGAAVHASSATLPGAPSRATGLPSDPNSTAPRQPDPSVAGPLPPRAGPIATLTAADPTGTSGATVGSQPAPAANPPPGSAAIAGGALTKAGETHSGTPRAGAPGGDRAPLLPAASGGPTYDARGQLVAAAQGRGAGASAPHHPVPSHTGPAQGADAPPRMQTPVQPGRSAATTTEVPTGLPAPRAPPAVVPDAAAGSPSVSQAHAGANGAPPAGVAPAGTNPAAIRVPRNQTPVAGRAGDPGHSPAAVPGSALAASARTPVPAAAAGSAAPVLPDAPGLLRDALLHAGQTRSAAVAATYSDAAIAPPRASGLADGLLVQAAHSSLVAGEPSAAPRGMPIPTPPATGREIPPLTAREPSAGATPRPLSPSGTEHEAPPATRQREIALAPPTAPGRAVPREFAGTPGADGAYPRRAEPRRAGDPPMRARGEPPAAAEGALSPESLPPHARARGLSIADTVAELRTQDFKAALLRLAGTLSEWLQRSAPARSASRTPATGRTEAEHSPLYTARGIPEAPAALPGAGAEQRGPGASPEQTGGRPVPRADADAVEQLMRYVEGALARTRVHQFGAVHETRGSPDTQSVPTWIAEIPLAHARGVDLLQLRIENHAHAAAAQEGTPRLWQVLMCIDCAATGPLHALLRLSGHRLSATLWAERASTLRAARATLAELDAALRGQGVEVEQLECVPGRPAERIGARFDRLLDVRT